MAPGSRQADEIQEQLQESENSCFLLHLTSLVASVGDKSQVPPGVV